MAETDWDLKNINRNMLKESETVPEKDNTHPNHYSSFAIEPLEYITKNKLGFCEGNIIKYVTRYKLKNGLEDLQKAKYYIERLIEENSHGE
jgi:hypothetical protein